MAMNDEVTLQLCTFDRTRKAEVTLPRSLTGLDLVEASRQNWQLPGDTEYHLMNTTRGLQIPPRQHLTPEVVQDGDVVTLQPLLVAGGGSVVDARRAQDERSLEELCRRSGGRVAIETRAGSPPFQYVLRFRLRSIRAVTGDRPVYADEHRVEVTLPARYPLEPPLARLLTPLHHPHVYPSQQVCLGLKHLPTEFLDRFAERLARILVFDPALIDFRSPADPAAMAWVRKVWDRGLFPTDQGLAPEGQAPARAAIRWNEGGAVKWS